MEETSTALNLQSGLKRLHVDPKGDIKGTLKDLEAQLPPPRISPSHRLRDAELFGDPGKHLVNPRPQCLPLGHSSQLVTQLQPGCLQKRESLTPIKPSKSCPALNKRKSRTEICLLLLSVCAPSHKSVKRHTQI